MSRFEIAALLGGLWLQWQRRRDDEQEECQDDIVLRPFDLPITFNPQKLSLPVPNSPKASLSRDMRNCEVLCVSFLISTEY